MTFGAPPGIIAVVSRLFHPKITLKLEFAWCREAGLDQLLSKYWNSIVAQGWARAGGP